MLGTVCPNSTYNSIMLSVQTALVVEYIRKTGYCHMYTTYYILHSFLKVYINYALQQSAIISSRSNHWHRKSYF